MARRNLEVNSIVLAQWVDAGVTHGWRPTGEIVNDTLAHCRTVGIIKNITEEKLTLAFGDSDCGNVMETIDIPTGNIKSIQELKC
jgi:hypothetical protein